MTILQKVGVWGDSVLKGVILDEIRGTYRLLARNSVQMVAQALNIQIINKARFGSTIKKGYDHLRQSLDKGLDCDLVLLEYGGNDCDFDWVAVAADPTALHLPKTPLPEFLETLESMADLLQDHGIRPVLMSLPPISGSRYLEHIVSRGPDRGQLLRFLGDAQQIYQYHEWYSLSITRLAARLRCLYAPVREAFLAQGHCQRFLCSDGIHPNEEGHQLMESVFTRLGEQVISQSFSPA